MSFIEKLTQEFHTQHAGDLLRESAFAAFLEHGLPTRRVDNWRYTNLRALTLMNAESVDEQRTVDEILAGLPSEFKKLVIIDGAPRQEYSDLELHWVNESKPAQIDVAKHPLAVLNLAMNCGGLHLQVPEQTRSETPWMIVQISTAASAGVIRHYRHSITLERQSKASIIFCQASTGNFVQAQNALIEVKLEEGAVLHYASTQLHNEQALHIEGLHCEQAAHSQLEASVLSLEASLSRYDFSTNYLGPQAGSKMYGVYSIKAKQHTDLHFNAEHRVPYCSTVQTVRGVLDDQAKAVFNGRVCVHPQAKHSTSEQANHNLLLSTLAEVDTKPELEIYNDEVKCAHGATVGQLDQDALFYLQARGLSETEARAILQQAFVLQVFEQITEPAFKTYLESLYLSREGGLDEY